MCLGHRGSLTGTSAGTVFRNVRIYVGRELSNLITAAGNPDPITFNPGRSERRRMQAVIPAAGRGTRMESLTANRPKGLVEVADRPLISYAFDAAIDGGADELLVVIGYRGDEIRDRLGDRYRDRQIVYVRQPEPSGLADAIARCDGELRGSFLVVNGDNVLLGDIDAVTRPVDAGADGALLVDRVDRRDAAATGVVETEGDRIVRVTEKPADPVARSVTTGVYLLPHAAVHACHLVEPSDRGEYELADAVSLLAYAGYRLEAVPYEGERVNVNTPDDVERARRLIDARG